MHRKLLVIDDDVTTCRLMAAIFVPEGFDVTVAHDGLAGLQRIAKEEPDVLVLDLQLPGLGGLEVLESVRASHLRLPVIVSTAHDEVRSAVRAMHLGATDYLAKPIDHEEIVVVVRRALAARDLLAEVEDLRRQLGSEAGLAAQMGPSAEVREVIEQVNIVAASNFTVLILGETGTGKELVAQAIHRRSERRERPYSALDCGAIPEALIESELFGHEKGAFSGADRRTEGRFQLAEGGTLFLDEIGNLAPALQGKLLRVLESREVHAVGSAKARPLDVRFLAATNLDLRARVNDSGFRADLYFRLAQYTISLPALRERTDDIPYLAARFLDEASIELRKPVRTIVPEVMELLAGYSWPGNVRELRNVIRQAVLRSADLAIRADVVRVLLGHAGPADATDAAPNSNGRSLKEIADEAAHGAERRAIREALRATGGNKAQAAKTLKTDYKTLHIKMKHLGIQARDFSA